jgi:hypothetical protein
MVGVVAVVFSIVLTQRSSKATTGDEQADSRVTNRRPQDVPIPSAFRKNEPRHWRYMMLSPSR